MTEEEMPSGLLAETRQAAAAWQQGRGPDGSQPIAPEQLQPGQVLVLPQLEEPRLAWALLSREGSDRLLLVPADAQTLVGPGDVAATGPAIGALTLRCRFGAWVQAADLGAATLLGSLPPESLARANARWQAVAAGAPLGTFSEQETEESPDYQDWIEDVVRPALARLEEKAGADAPSSLPVRPFPSRPKAALAPPRGGAWLRWAAALAFVALGAGSGALWWRQGQQIADLRAAAETSEAAHRQAVAALEARREELEAQYQAQLREAGEDRVRLEVEHQARLAELERELATLRRVTDVKNPVWATLDPGAVQRGSETVTVGPEVSHVLLVLPVGDPKGTEFQVEVRERRSGRQVLIQSGLQADVFGEVRLGIPTALLPPGDYRVVLLRKRGEAFERIRDHGLEIKDEPRRRPLRW